MRRSIGTFAYLFGKQNKMLSERKLITEMRNWKFKNPPSYGVLPINFHPEYNIPVAVKNAVFSKVPTEPLTGTLRLVCASDNALIDILDLSLEITKSQDFVDFVAGQYLPEGHLIVAHRYGGYQFGEWSDQLGDGRAHILGEYVNSKGETWQIQLKGSGETPYSRFGDGRAVLRSSIREMIASEACFHLGIPTTRAAALVVSDELKVWRDKLYSGFAKQERTAIVMRLAPAWYRIGSIEILYKRKELDLMKTLVDFIIKHHFPWIVDTDDDKYVKWYSDVACRNLDMVATWQGMGFTHGVLNTDNVSLLGLTIDYGPYGFLDHYYQHYVSNTSDDIGRYAYNQQPKIMLWNLEKFAEALESILTDDQKDKIREARKSLDEYVVKKVAQTYLLKLGLKELKDGDGKLIHDLLQMMENTTADYTCTFRQLSEVDSVQLLDKSALSSKWALSKICESNDWENWVRRYQYRLVVDNVSEEERCMNMNRVNPIYVPRNWMMEEAIVDAENNDFQKVQFLLKVLQKPFDVDEEAEKRNFSAPPPSWSYGLKLSCSS